MLVTAAEYAKLYGCSKQWIAELCRTGRMGAERVGKAWMIEHTTPLPESAAVVRKRERAAVLAELMASMPKRNGGNGAVGLDYYMDTPGYYVRDTDGAVFKGDERIDTICPWGPEQRAMLKAG